MDLKAETGRYWLNIQVCLRRGYPVPVARQKVMVTVPLPVRSLTIFCWLVPALNEPPPLPCIVRAVAAAASAIAAAATPTAIEAAV